MKHLTSPSLSDLPTFRPMNRSRSEREDRMAQVRARVANIGRLLADQGRAERAKDLPAAQEARAQTLRNLLWARAEIERAIWLETSGRMGTQYATASTTLRTLPIRVASATIDND